LFLNWQVFPDSGGWQECSVFLFDKRRTLQQPFIGSSPIIQTQIKAMRKDYFDVFFVSVIFCHFLPPKIALFFCFFVIPKENKNSRQVKSILPYCFNYNNNFGVCKGFSAIRLPNY
jgi:hypothetical protein